MAGEIPPEVRIAGACAGPARDRRNAGRVSCSASRRVRGWLKPTAPQGWTGIHRPFPSATRRPAGQSARGEPAGPWLCAPASRRVCPFEEERCGARNAPAHAPDQATKTRPAVCYRDSRTTSCQTQISPGRNVLPGLRPSIGRAQESGSATDRVTRSNQSRWADGATRCGCDWPGCPRSLSAR